MARWCATVAVCALVLACVCADPLTEKTRQQPQRPRPFEPAGYLPPATGYPPSGSRPTPSYNEGSSSANSPYKPSEPNETSPPYESEQPAYSPPYESNNLESSQRPYLPSQPPYQPEPSQPPYQPEPSQPPYQPAPTQPPYQPGPSQPPYQPAPSQPPYQPAPSQPSYKPEPSQPSYQPSPSQPPYQPSQPSQPPYQPSQPTSAPYQPDLPSQPSSPDEDNEPLDVNGEQSPAEPGEDNHPPHIHAITVDCGKEMMTINLEFDKPYNGIIYSQGHYNEPECIYLKENSNKIKFSFTVSLNICGTQFISDFQSQGQAFLENVLVFQNEAGIQEVWDHIRRVRCLWAGSLNRRLFSSLNVGMLNQVTTNFSGDTAMAHLDIRMGRGPFSPEASGLVKIGQQMTLVVSITGDAAFDVHVRQCIARDYTETHMVPLTDHDGCVLKPKLFGAFQKTRETRNTGASIIAYAYFNAFKFPDEMNLVIECDVELCKTDCGVCDHPGSYDPSRRRRRDVIHIGNDTTEPVTVGKGLRVVFAEDLPEPSGLCLSPTAAVWGFMLVLVSALTSSAIASYCWQKYKNTSPKNI